jgi:5-methylcytosine-specific restriction protein A
LKEPFIIEINIPKKEFVLELAKEFYKNEESVLDQIGEWPLSYQHKVSKDLIEYFYDIEKKETIENKIVNSPRSFLFIGGSIWSSEVSIVDGEMEYHENIENIIEGDSNIEKINEVSSFVEGKKYWINISRYERDDSARKRCLDHYGSSCQICGFNFEKVYGSFGKDIIHVHHKKPLADIGKEYIVDPIKDLIPVCANCHTIIHSKEEAFSIIEVIQMIKRK